MADTSVLTDGTGISALTTSKVVKDLVLDFALTAAAALTAVNIVDVDGALQNPYIVGTAVGGALLRTLFRFVVRWATT